MIRTRGELVQSIHHNPPPQPPPSLLPPPPPPPPLPQYDVAAILLYLVATLLCLGVVQWMEVEEGKRREDDDGGGDEQQQQQQQQRGRPHKYLDEVAGILWDRLIPGLRSNTKRDVINKNNNNISPDLLYLETVNEEHAPNYRRVRPGEWVRPLGSMEAMMAYGGSLGTFNTVQALWLTSTQPVSTQHVREAVSWVARRTAVLQLCVQHRALRPWFRRMSHDDVPFSVEEDDPLAVYTRALHERYDMERGPLWRARLVLGCVGTGCDGGDESDGEGGGGGDGGGGGGSGDGVWEAVVVVAVQHCLTDGFTNMLLCQDLLEALNALVTKGAAPHLSPRPVTPAVSGQLVRAADYLYVLPYLVRKVLGRLVFSYNSQLYLDGALPRAAAASQRLTRVLQRRLSRSATQQLVTRCRGAGVTVHSCVVAAANLALLRVAQLGAAPRTLHRAALNTTNCVDLRRYFPARLRGAAGCHISLEEHEQLVRAQDGVSGAAFWSFAAVLHARLQRSLTVQRNPVRNEPMFRACCLMLAMNHCLGRRGWPHRTDAHLVTTNMGDLRAVLPGVAAAGGPVEARHMLRSVSAELGGHPFTLTFHTFRGRLLLSLDYFSTKAAPEVAPALMHQLYTLLDALAHTGEPTPPPMSASEPPPPQ